MVMYDQVSQAFTQCRLRFSGAVVVKVSRFGNSV